MFYTAYCHSKYIHQFIMKLYELQAIRQNAGDSRARTRGLNDAQTNGPRHCTANNLLIHMQLRLEPITLISINSASNTTTFKRHHAKGLGQKHFEAKQFIRSRGLTTRRSGKTN